MTENYSEAMNLMIEDLYTIRTDIRHQAKLLNCEQELNEIRNDVIEYLKSNLSKN